MKNILLLINQLHTGGAQKVVSRLSMELGKSYHVSLVTYNTTESMFDYAGEHIFIKLPFSDNPSGNNPIARFIRFIVLIYQLRKIKKEKKIQTAISFLEASNIVNVLSRRKEKVILSVRSHLSSEFKDDKRLYIFKRLIKLLYNKAYRVVVPSALMKIDLADNFSVNENKMSVIYNFIDKDQIRELVKEHEYTDLEKMIFQSPVMINVGRLTNPKAQWFLLDILSKVKTTVPDIKLVILGEGSLKERLLNTANKLGLNVYNSTDPQSFRKDNDVFLLGFKENPFPYLSKSTLMVSTSIYEGFPNAMIEAMACGLPVVSSDCPSGPREILAPDTDINTTTYEAEYAAFGILLPVLNEQDVRLQENLSLWNNAIVDLLQNDKKRIFYASKSSERSDDYNKKTIIQKWITLIESQ